MTIPDFIPEFDYFLKSVSTPGWHFVFRVAFAVSFLLILGSYWYYARKEKKGEK